MTDFGDIFTRATLFSVGTAVLFVSTASADESVTPASEPGERSVKPGINDSFLDPDLDVEEWVNRFEVESREVFAARDQIVKAVGLRTGDRVADVGTGTGPFVEPFSEAVGPGGWVFALDIAPKFVERVARLAELKGLPNVTPVLATEDSIALPPDSVDAIFICDVYHHFEYPQTSLASIVNALRPGGQLVLIDFERIPGVSREWTIGHVRAGKETFRAEIQAARLKFVEEVNIEGFKENYFLRFQKPTTGD